jgi:hypothetical protein
MVRISSVRPAAGLSVELRFANGLTATVDLAPLLRGPIFEPLVADPVLFRAVRVDHGLGTIVWPNGADLDPDVLHDRARAAPCPG